MLTSITTWMKQNPIPAFFAGTFLIAWSLWLPLGFFAPDRVLLTLPGAWVPTISALILIGLSEGRLGIRRFLKKILHWRVGAQWYLVTLFAVAAIAYLAIGVATWFGAAVPEISLPNGLPAKC